MNVVLVYPFPLLGTDSGTPANARAEFYKFAKRWVGTYTEFPPDFEHKIVVAFGTDADVKSEDMDVFRGLPCEFMKYGGSGIDCGCAQFVAKNVSADFMCAMTSRVYFHRRGWLKRLVEAREKYGRGLYGAVGSYEACPVELERGPSPHLRTVFYGLSPDDFCKYPFQINNRHEAHQFEAGERSLTNWFLDRGLPVKMVTFAGEYDLPQWRDKGLREIFRRDSQRGILVHDKHSDAYRDASPEQKQRMARSADGV